MADKLQFKQLQQFIPGLTRYRFTMARTHTITHGPGVPLQPETVVKERYERGKLEHFLEFITSLTSFKIYHDEGECIYTSNVISIMIPERIIQQYNSLCEEGSMAVVHICDAIKGNESDVGESRTEIWPR